MSYAYLTKKIIIIRGRIFKIFLTYCIISKQDKIYNSFPIRADLFDKIINFRISCQKCKNSCHKSQMEFQHFKIQNF